VEGHQQRRRDAADRLSHPAITPLRDPHVGVRTPTLSDRLRNVDQRTMASLPALPSLATLRRAKSASESPSAEDLAAQVDAKLRLARRLHAEDEARRTTSIAPPPPRHRRA
jgi:hypothetical protein